MATWFEDKLCYDPTVLFRIFHYPSTGDTYDWGVGEHTDYGLLTLLLQDTLVGGLQIMSREGGWVDVPPDDGGNRKLVVNIGDMLDKLTKGLYRSTPHRVKRNSTGTGRLSFPLFFDPSWTAVVLPLPIPTTTRAIEIAQPIIDSSGSDSSSDSSDSRKRRTEAATTTTTTTAS